MVLRKKINDFSNKQRRNKLVKKYEKKSYCPEDELEMELIEEIPNSF
jgi:hypothetical protein